MRFRRRVILFTSFILIVSSLAFLLQLLRLPTAEELENNEVEFSREEVEGEVAQVDEEEIMKKLLAIHEIDWTGDRRRKLNITRLWNIAASWVTPSGIHPEHAPEIGPILMAMNRERIVGVDFGYRGSQLKLMLTLEGGQRLVFKPQWYDRSHVIEGKPYDGHDRHNAEIVAFHLNRIIGFYRSPLTVGRRINLAELFPFATERLGATFFKNGSNTCFYGRCLYCKGPSDGVCAHGDVMEGAVVLMLPKRFKFTKYHHPWGRTYLDGKLARWETNADHYCEEVERREPYVSNPRLILDIIDAAVFDYIIGNADRHHYEVFENTTGSMLIMFDNAKSIRSSTFERLRQLQRGLLVMLLRSIVDGDPIAPLLTQPHYDAMERRLDRVIKMITFYLSTGHNGRKDFLVTEP